MKHFYIIANPEYFKKSMGWDMKHNDIKYTNDNLVMFVASENVPVTHFEPYYCSCSDSDIELDSKSIYESYCILNNETENKYCKGEK